MNDQPTKENEMDEPETIRISGGRTPDAAPLTMDEQYDMLRRLWGVDNGDATVEIWRDGNEYPWHIAVESFDMDHHDASDLQGPTVELTRRTAYSGDTLVEAIDFAWRRHRGPVECARCEGDGVRDATADEIAQAEDDGLRLSVSVRCVDGPAGRVRREFKVVNCEACDAMGWVRTLPKPAADPL